MRHWRDRLQHVEGPYQPLLLADSRTLKLNAPSLHRLYLHLSNIHIYLWASDVRGQHSLGILLLEALRYIRSVCPTLEYLYKQKSTSDAKAGPL